MTVGERIRYIRLLRGMSQREVGEAAGFPVSSASVRIRQYEMGLMEPKADKSEKIAAALGVHPDVLTSNDLDNDVKVMMALFEFEKSFGMRISKSGDDYVLTVPENEFEPNSFSMRNALSAWYAARQRYDMDEKYTPENQVHDYELWTQEFPLNLKREEHKYQEQIQSLYLGRISDLLQSGFKITYASECIQLMEKMTLAKIPCEIAHDAAHSSQDARAVRISYPHTRILRLSDEAGNLFTQFLAMIDLLQDAGISIAKGTHTYETETFEDFYVINSMLSAMFETTVRTMQESIKNGTFQDWNVQSEYQDDLQQFHVPISEYV